MGNAVPTNLSEQTTWCSNRKLMRKGGGLQYVETPNGGFLLAVPTNLSEQTTIYNSACGNPIM